MPPNSEPRLPRRGPLGSAARRVRLIALAAALAPAGCIDPPARPGGDGGAIDAASGGGTPVALDHELGSLADSPGGDSITLTTDNPVKPGATVVLLVSWYVVQAPSETLSVSGGGLTWTEMRRVAFYDQRDKLALVSAQAPDGLPFHTDITASFDNQPTGLAIAGASFVGVAPDTPLDATAAATQPAGTASWASGTVTTTRTGDLLVALAMGDGRLQGDTGSSPDAPWIEVPEPSGDFADGNAGEAWTMVYRVGDGPGDYSASGSLSLAPDNGTGALLVAFPPALDTAPRR